MDKEITEINVDMELNDYLSVELQIDCVRNGVRIIKVTDKEEEVSNDGIL